MTVRFDWDDTAFLRLMDSTECNRLLDEKALEMIAIAQGIYQSEAKGESRGPVIYEAEFYVRRLKELGVPVRVVGNADPEAIFVEFGLNAGGSHRVYKYRVMGRTLDAMEEKT